MGHLLPDKQLARLPVVGVLHQAPKRAGDGREKGREWKRTDRGRVTAAGGTEIKAGGEGRQAGVRASETRGVSGWQRGTWQREHR